MFYYSLIYILKMAIKDNTTVHGIGLMSNRHTENKNYINRISRLHENCREIVAHQTVYR